MGAISLTGNDTFILNGRPIVNLADGDCIDLKFPNEIANVKIGKNGNAIYGFNATGQMSEAVIRIMRGQADDIYLNGQLNAQQSNFAGFILMNGVFIKKVGDGQGNITSDTYVMAGGVFVKIPEAKNNVEGNTDQSVVIYTLRFANQQNVRSIT